PAFHLGDAQGLYRRWRAEDPVRWDAASSMWLVTRHADVVHVSRNPALFCSGRGVLLGDRDREFSSAESILYLDPPLHSRYRRIVATQFHGDEVARLRDRIRRLARELLDGERLSTAEVLGFCISLLVAGNETTRHLLSGGLGALSRHPEQWRRLRDQPGLVSIAVEEMLRWVTPFNGFARTATAAVELGG